MATIRVKAPDGKTLSITVAPGTDPSQYGAAADEAVATYMKNSAAKSLEFERGPEYPAASYTTDAPSMDIAMGIQAAPGLVKAVPAVAKGIAAGAKAVGEGVGSSMGEIGETAGKVGGKLADMAKGGYDWLTNNTPRAFGYAQSAGETPEARQLARDAIEFANKAHPELADLATQAATRPIASASGAPQLAKGADMIPYGTEGGAEAATDLPKPDVSSFAGPIKSSMLSSPEDMLKVAQTQQKAVGKAIENTLGKYDATGISYDPKPFSDQVKSMLERDVNGVVIEEGPAGEINAAMKEAATALNAFSKGGPIKWSDAARVKTLMQGNGKWGQQGLSRAQEAYNSVTTLLKEDIDRQATEMLAKNGGDVASYQRLRDAYGKLSSLTDSINVAAKRKFSNSPIPWWVKMAGGETLGSGGTAAIKGILGH